MSAVSIKELIHTDRQIIRFMDIPKGGCFSNEPIGCEESFVVMEGVGRMGDREVVPVTLGTKVDKIWSDSEPMRLYWIQAIGESKPKDHFRRREDCVEIKPNDKEKIHELFGKGNGDAQKHSVAIVEIAPGGSSDAHYHPKVEESYMIDEGEGELVINSEKQRVATGDAKVIPVGALHQIFNVGKGPLKLTVVCVPPWTSDCGVYTNTNSQK